jgi:hypothetical protein
MRRVGLTAAFGLALGGCATTHMTAPEAPVPVLVGPVACIGCPATPPPAGQGPLVSDVAKTWGGTFVLPFLGDTELHVNKPAQLGSKAGQSSPDVCRTDARVTRIKATSFGLFAFVVVSVEDRVEVDAALVQVPNGNCPGRATFPGAPPPFPGAPPPAGAP